MKNLLDPAMLCKEASTETFRQADRLFTANLKFWSAMFEFNPLTVTVRDAVDSSIYGFLNPSKMIQTK